VANPAVVVDFVANTKDLQRANAEIGTGGSKAASALKRAAVPAAAALGAIAVGAKKAVDAASSLNEQMSASQQVFGRQAKGVQEWSKTSAEAFGLSRTEALKAANAYGNMLSTVGLAPAKTAKMSQAMVQLAGDMASFHDQDPSEMLEKLRSGLSGEAEPLRQFGVLISDAAVKQKAYQTGIAKTGAELTEGQKVQARYALIMDQTAKAQGDFARTSGSVANQQRTLAAENENAAASFGQALLPVTQAFLKIMRGLLGVLGEHQKTLQILVGVIAALAATVITINAATATWTALQTAAKAATVAWTFAQQRLNLALLANPIGLIVVAIGALVAAFVLAYTRSETFRKLVTGALDAVKDAAVAVFDWLKGNWPKLLAILTGPIGVAAYTIIRHWDAIKNAVQAAVAAIKGWVTDAWERIRQATLGAWGAVTGMISGAIATIKTALSSFAGWVTGFASGVWRAAVEKIAAVWGIVEHGARAAVTGVKDALNGMIDWLTGIVERVRNVASDVANAIKRPINAVIKAWNGLQIPRLEVRLPKKKILGKTIGGGSFGFGPVEFPDIPQLARGAVVTSPTLAMVGEGSGAEIVAPERLLRDIVGDRRVEVRVYIGDTELRGLVRTEIVDADTGLARTLLAGGR
jgi:hypothetical protein